MQATIKAIQQKTGIKDMSLRDVPMDSFQVCCCNAPQHPLKAAVPEGMFWNLINSTADPTPALHTLAYFNCVSVIASRAASNHRHKGCSVRLVCRCMWAGSTI